MANNGKNQKQNAIMLSKYLIGSFGDSDASNIPHEIINEFRADDGKQYIYIPPYGGFDTKKYDIKYVLFTGTTSFKSKKGSEGDYQCFEIKYLVEVDHLLKGVEGNESNKAKQQQIMKDNEEVPSICYGTAPLTSIPMVKNGDSFEEKAFYATFMAKAIYKLKDDIKMRAGYGFEATENDIKMDQNTIVLEDASGNKTKSYKFQRQRGYVSEKLDNGSGNSNYEKFISKILDSNTKKINDNYWVEINNPQIEYSDSEKSIIERRKASMNFMRLILREWDETAYSNLMFNFFDNNKKLLNAFVSEVLGMPDDDYKIYKEVYVSVPKKDTSKKDTSKGGAKSGRVDLLIIGNNNIAVIENKIKSGLNGVDEENKISQLSLYYWVFNNNLGSCGKLERKNELGASKNCICFILKPNYADIDWDCDPEMERKYTVINYENMYTFLDGKKDFCESDLYKRYFDDFRNALYVHTLSREEDIKSRFLMAIEKANGTNC